MHQLPQPVERRGFVLSAKEFPSRQAGQSRGRMRSTAEVTREQSENSHVETMRLFWRGNKVGPCKAGTKYEDGWSGFSRAHRGLLDEQIRSPLFKNLNSAGSWRDARCQGIKP